MFESKIIANSRHADGRKVTTYKLRYPRMIHSEFMTHRVFSRNASSSRAIPVSKMLSWSEADMYVPKFRLNQKGMQPGDYLDAQTQLDCEIIWENTARMCMEAAEALSSAGVHKQWANRMIEWFGYINVCVTSSQWSNFFALRTELNDEGYPVPQDEIYFLACEMQSQLENEPTHLLKEGMWHLPYVTYEDYTSPMNIQSDEDLNRLIRISVARCARNSYLTVEGKRPTIDEDLALYDRLLAKHPIHASPAEHQCTFDEKVEHADYWGDPLVSWKNPELGGNLGPGFIQYRKTLPGECL